MVTALPDVRFHDMGHPNPCGAVLDCATGRIAACKPPHPCDACRIVSHRYRRANVPTTMQACWHCAETLSLRGHAGYGWKLCEECSLELSLNRLGMPILVQADGFSAMSPSADRDSRDETVTCFQILPARAGTCSLHPARCRESPGCPGRSPASCATLRSEYRRCDQPRPEDGHGPVRTAGHD